MAYWTKCPECGETNYYETGYTQVFDCGFKGSNFDSRREMRCGGSGKPTLRQKAGRSSADADDTGSRYRLALLDASRVADLIAADMARAIGRSDPGAEFADRCRELAEQMRAFAGHGRDAQPASFDDLGKSREPGTGLSRFAKKIKLW